MKALFIDKDLEVTLLAILKEKTINIYLTIFYLTRYLYLIVYNFFFFVT